MNRTLNISNSQQNFKIYIVNDQIKNLYNSYDVFIKDSESKIYEIEYNISEQHNYCIRVIFASNRLDLMLLNPPKEVQNKFNFEIYRARLLKNENEIISTYTFEKKKNLIKFFQSDTSILQYKEIKMIKAVNNQEEKQVKLISKFECNSNIKILFECLFDNFSIFVLFENDQINIRCNEREFLLETREIPGVSRLYRFIPKL